MHGSNTIGAELAPALARAFAECAGLSGENVEQSADPDERRFSFTGAETDRQLRVEIFAHGSGTAPPDLVARKTDIGMMSRRINSDEIDRLVAAGLGRPIPPPASDSGGGPAAEAGYEHVIALDGIAVMVNREQSVNQLAICDVARIFAGQITDWSAVGGTPGAIRVHARDAKSGTWDTFNELVLKPCNVTLTPTATRYEANQDLSRAVEIDRNAIGFAGYAYIINTKALQISTTCPIVVPPSEFLIKTEEYPISRRLYMYAPPALQTPLTKTFLDFVASNDAQPAVSSAGFVNLAITGGGAAYTAQRIAAAAALPAGDASAPALSRFARLVTNAERLSATIRFETGSWQLDARARRDVGRIGEMARSGRFRGRQVILAGFTDSRGPWDMNLSLSLNRANTVAQELLQDIPNIRPYGFGFASPVACNGTDAGLRLNRRVEIWVSPPLTGS